MSEATQTKKRSGAWWIKRITLALAALVFPWTVFSFFIAQRHGTADRLDTQRFEETRANERRDVDIAKLAGSLLPMVTSRGPESAAALEVIAWAKPELAKRLVDALARNGRPIGPDVAARVERTAAGRQAIEDVLAAIEDGRSRLAHASFAEAYRALREAERELPPWLAESVVRSQVREADLAYQRREFEAAAIAMEAALRPALERGAAAQALVEEFSDNTHDNTHKGATP